MRKMMKTIQIFVNGLPGNMAVRVVTATQNDARFDVLPVSLTGPEIEETEVNVSGQGIRLFQPHRLAETVAAIENIGGPVIAIDFTHPSAVYQNTAFYCEQQLPFVMGTTGGNQDQLVEMVESSQNTAVIAPNMAKPIVAFQEMVEHAAVSFPAIFKNYKLTVVESHQQGKADTSGTAKAVVGSFNKMGLSFEVEEINKVRDPKVQQEMGIPEKYLSGHGWHTYTLTSPDETVKLQFTHNVNGRQVYMPGILDSVEFLNQQVQAGVKGRVFNMMDVLKGGSTSR